jgi:hypothetical protein
LKATSEHPAAINIDNSDPNVNVTDCVFRNISNSYDSPNAGAINYPIDNVDYNISNNIFYDISTNRSVLSLFGSFSSLLFSDNTFYNVSSFNEGGVFFFFLLFLFYLGNLVHVFNKYYYFFILLFC